MRLGNWKLWAGVAVVILIGGMVFAQSRRSVSVETAAVRRATLRATIDEAATTRVRNRADITAPVSGRFVPADVEVGDTVERGATIGVLLGAPLDPVTEAQTRQRVAALTAALSAARTRVDVAQSVANIATRDAERAQRLFNEGAISQRELDAAKAAATTALNDLEAARAGVNEVEAERAAAQAALAASGSEAGSGVAVRSPRRGRILRLFEESPRVVLAGTPLAQVGNIDELEAVIPILSADAPRVRPGASVFYVLGSSADTIAGAVKLVEPAAFTKLSALGIEEQRVNVIATVQDSLGRLGAEYRLDARIVTWEDEVLQVPMAALVRDGDAWTVFVIRDGRAQRVRVDIGQRAADAAEVRAGLSDGDVVILYPAEDISDGVRVDWRDDRRARI